MQNTNRHSSMLKQNIIRNSCTSRIYHKSNLKNKSSFCSQVRSTQIYQNRIPLLNRSNIVQRSSENMVVKTVRNLKKINKLSIVSNLLRKQIQQQQLPTQQQNIEIQAVLNSGNFSSIYLAKAPSQIGYIILKKVRIDCKYFNREQQMAKLLKNPFIVKFHKTFIKQQEDGNKYLNILMQKYDYSLHELFKLVSSFNQLQIKIYAYQLLRGIMYLHSSNICHRDIKPQNIFVRNHSLVIGDFGSAKIMDKSNKNVAYICSRYYRAPELILGYTGYNESIDIWAAGCTIAQLVKKKPIFEGSSNLNQLIKIFQVLGTPNWRNLTFLKQKPPKIPQITGRGLQSIFSLKVSQQFINLLGKMIAINPYERCSAAQLLTHTFFDDIRDEQHYTQVVNFYNDYLKLFSFTRKQLKGNQHLINKLIPTWIKNRLQK